MASIEKQEASQPADHTDRSNSELKADSSAIENARENGFTTYADDMANRLSEAHRVFLLRRHGTLDLDPLPSMDPADPYNWSLWKKIVNLLLVVFHAFMATFSAAAINIAFANISEQYNVSVQRASYLTSLQIAILGGAPLFWNPFSNRFGRRPVFLLSLICSLVANIGCAKSPDYTSAAICRAIEAFFICPASAIGSGVVTETFFKKDRARYMGIWTVMVTLGIPLAPFLFGFVTYRVGYRWIYWVLAIVNACQFVLYLFFGPETRYLGNNGRLASSWRTQYFSLRRIDPTPFSLYDFIHPLTMAVKHPSVIIPTAAHAMVFLFSNILLAINVPQLLQAKFKLNAEQLGLQFLGLIIGSIIGEQFGGILSDIWMNRREKKIQQKPQPEFRLWLSYFGFLLAIVGVIVSLVCTEQAADGHWVISPVIGAAIAAGGNQVTTTVLITYAVDCYPEEAASVGVFIMFVRQIWGFLGPFWFTPMFENVGVSASAGVGTALIVGVSVIPTILLQWKGAVWRRSKIK
ncbi:transporter [Aspergillus sclerotialis]|uniref:Transporter n=1 Tax=Aspergillus sclerotialis TaxID=2070753 RepID=A0A3A2ZFG8_9EURO|nr:transporter [Aspergillus sclerotialis]